MAKITCYDGVACIGGNKILLEDGKTAIWFDFGTDFGTVTKYYEEFLNPKACLGLYEPLQMGLLPPIKGLYRDDLVTALADPWEGIEARDIDEVSGILLSHAHLDHIGALHYVKNDIPIYCSAMTAAIARASQDVGQSGNDFCYAVPREQCETGELGSDRKAASQRRPFFLVDEQASETFIESWLTSAGTKESIGPSIGTASCAGDMRIYRFPVDHSIYGACAWAVQTNCGVIVYTGDIRCHGRNRELTFRFAEEVAKLKPRLLIIEGTRIGSDSSSTEEDIAARALKEVKKAQGLVVADFGPRNVERMETFLEIAKKTGRRLLVTMKDAYLLEWMGLVDASVPSLTDETVGIYCEFERGDRTWKKKLREKYEDKLVAPQTVKQNQREHICCFSFWDVNELAYLKPIPGSIWIYSSCEPFNEEMRFDMERLKAWLDRFGVVPLGMTSKDEKNRFHVSGHACRRDLLKVIDIISPQTVVPIHVEKENLQKFTEVLHGKCECVLPEKGVSIEL